MSAQTAFDEIFAKGGVARIALLRYCVMSIAPEPVFAYLVGEYRMRPGAAAASALYEVFCAPDAPFRIGAPELLPPRDLRLTTALRAFQGAGHSNIDRTGDSPVPMRTPGKHVFDYLVVGLSATRRRRLSSLAEKYDPRLTPEENLPAGRQTPAQRQFVQNVWRPVARPRLVAAGFWQVASIE